MVEVVLLYKSFFTNGLEQVSSLYDFVIMLKPIFFSKMLE